MQRHLFRRVLKKSRKRLIRYGLLTANVSILVTVVWFVAHNPQAGHSIKQNALGSSSDLVAANPLDQLSSADIAAHVANLTRLDQVRAVENNADTVNAQLTITSTDEQVVAKPQIVATANKSRSDLQKYVTVEGDTVSGLAAKFGITSDTIRWSNALGASDSLAANKELVISPVNGIVYEVKAGDTVETVAQKFSANKDQLIAFNDAEVQGLKVGEKIVVPDGVFIPPARTVARSPAGASFAFGGNAPIYSGNGYDYGYCTWWVAVRRAQIGRPLPSNLGNASTWKVLAGRAGLGVGNVPAAGAAIWTPPHDYYGHVGFVEGVNADGSVEVSEMNVAGWGKVSHKTLSPAQAAGYSYIY